MSQYKISGGLNLSAIEAAVSSIEVTRNRLVGIRIEAGENIVTFVEQRVPPRPHFVLEGTAPPANTTLSWSGTVLVENEEVIVEIYRGQPAGTVLGPLSQQIEQVQQALNVGVDGAAGPETWSAIADHLQLPAATRVKRTDTRSEAVIATLLPQVQAYARALFFKAKERGFAMTLISGTRSFAEQDKLFAKGRDAQGRVIGKVVTNARGGYSNHNFGIAFDVALFDAQGKYIKDGALYRPVGVLGEEIGLEWGGRWTSLVDPSHFQLRPQWAAGMREAQMLARLRQEYPDGIDIPRKALAALGRQAEIRGLAHGLV